MLRFIEYTPQHRSIFKTLNEEWIYKYMPSSDHDKEVLDDPEGQIVDKGGEIIFAELNGQVIGTASLAKKANNKYELAKLAVTESAKGQGIGKALTQEIIRRAKAKDLSVLYLASSRVLKVAITMYLKLGFREINKANRTPQCDIEMVLKLD